MIQCKSTPEQALLETRDPSEDQVDVAVAISNTLPPNIMKEQVQVYVVNSQTLQLLNTTSQFFADQQQPVYLVGGSLRNLLLRLPVHDWDLVSMGDPRRQARGLADHLGSFYASMNENASRIIIKQDQEITFDLAPLKGDSLLADLQQRDFTVNALAAPLTNVVEHLTTGDPLHLIDPLHGADDLDRRLLRAVSETIFQDSPQRLLRAVRLSGHYHLSLEEITRALLQRDSHLLTNVAREIVHAELMAILAPEGALQQLHLLDSLGFLTTLIPEFEAARAMQQPWPHNWDVLEHSLQTIEMLEQFTRALRDGPTTMRLNLEDHQSQQDVTEIQKLLAEAEQQDIFKLADMETPQMKLATLLHDIGKPATFEIDPEGRIHFYGHPQIGSPIVATIMNRLGASTAERRFAQLIAAHHMRPGQLGQIEELTPRATRRYFLDLGKAGIPLTLISLADHLATIGPQEFNPSWGKHLHVVRQLLTTYIREREIIVPPRLLSAQELMRRLKLEQGPIIGKLLGTIADAQAEGRVHSKEEALWLAEEYLHAQHAGLER